MSIELEKKNKDFCLKNQKGQMAIFIALFFQVLFIFFAMAINVGMVVHDKINLQNSVDIAAYYGAMKQGEILNQIAHINYQMRQNYKLFVYRFRVIGSMGLDAHPYNLRSGAPSVGGETDSEAAVPPSYCVANPVWKEYFDLDENSNVCRRSSINLPNIPVLSGGTGIVPGFNNLVSFVNTTRAQFSAQCSEAGIFNWLVAARMLAHYRVDGAVRKTMINQLAALLNQPGAQMQDLRGERVQDGVERTLRNNLTAANNNQSLRIDFFNSMGEGACASRETWLPEVLINPVIRFTDLDGSNVNAGCRGEAIPNRLGAARTVTTGFNDNLPSGFGPSDPNSGNFRSRYLVPNQILAEHWQQEPSGDLHSSVGFEKNPWCLVYSGVNATTTVSKPFSPTGGTVELRARGFAQPFGGRIGPWYGRSWPSGSPNSTAGSATDQTDPLLPSRDAGGAPSGTPAQDLANHSRFPGDTLGMKSLRGITSMIMQARSLIGGNARMAWANYNHLGGGPNLRNTGDSLARDANTPTGNVPAAQRNLELAATAPDTFDAFYYSVEPSYFDNYFTAQTTNAGAALPADARIFDFGSTKDGGQPGTTQDFNIMQNIQNAVSMTGGSVNDYLINNWQHLLTSWHQESSVGFTLDQGRFGTCTTPVQSREAPTTGNCVVGGRTGYSIKNVSRDFLLSSDHALGGEDGGSAAIMNPPTF